MSAFNIYLLILLTKIPDLCGGIASILLLILFVISLFCFFTSGDPDEEIDKIKRKIHPWIKWIVLSIIVCITAITLIPTKEDLVTIYAGSYITQQKDLKNMPVNAAKAFNRLLTNYLNEEKK
jgi:cytochrome bd-type quinol oxidase subunit 2